MTSTDSKTFVTTPVELATVYIFLEIRHTIAVEDWYTRNIVVHELMDDIKHGRLHLRRLQIFVATKLEMSQRFPKQLSLMNVDCNEFEDAVLSDNADNHGPSSLIVNIDQRNPAGSSLQHATTCFVKRPLRVD